MAISEPQDQICLTILWFMANAYHDEQNAASFSFVVPSSEELRTIQCIDFLGARN